MAYIETVHEDEASGDLKDLYDEIKASRGKLSNILRVHSLNPDALRSHLQLYDALLFGRSGLKRATREAIAVVVSSTNGCDYCVRHHAEALNAYWKDDARTQQLADDYTALDLDPALRAACDYAARLTATADGTSDADVAAMREAGLSDRDVLDVTLIVAYFNFVNRIANGLGVAFTEEEATGYNY